MSSEFVDSSCTGKVRFATRHAATRVQDRRAKADGAKRNQQVYHCRICQGWHIGRGEAERPKHALRRWKMRYEGAHT